MADATITQPSFTAGEISPELYSRKDLARYQVAARKMNNVFVHAHGGASNRSGLKFAAEVKDSTKVNRITTFEAASDEAFLLVWGDLNLRPMFHGSYLDNLGSPYEIATPFTSADLSQLYMEQSNDVATIVHPLYPPRELARYDVLDWRMTQVTFQSSVPPPSDVIATTTEGYTGYDSSHLQVAPSYKVSAIGLNGEESLPSAVAVASAPLVLGYEQNFVTVTWTTDASYTRSSSDPGGNVGEGGRTKIDLTWQLDSGRTVTSIGLWKQSAGSVSMKIAQRTGPGAYTIISSASFAHPGGGWADYTLGVPYLVPAGDFYVASYSATNEKRNKNINGADVVGNAGVGAVGMAEGAQNTRAHRATYASIDGSVDEIDFYNVYKAQNGLYGYIGKATETSFKDTNFDPSFTQGPQSGDNPFVGAGNYPAVVTFCQQRRVFAQTDSRPQTVWETQAANFNNMGTSSPLRDDDAIEFTLASKKKQDIYHMVALDKGMIVFTRSGEWKVTGRDGDVITPSSVYPSQQSAYGAERTLKPLIVGEQILFGKHSGRNVLELGFSLQDDKYVAVDLTILAAHLFEGRKVIAWDYAAAPHSIIWAVMSDGKALSLTYLKEHDVWGWGRHETRGKFLDVSVVPEDTRDVPYFLISRRIGGVTKQYIEYMADRQVDDVRDGFFVDCGLSLDNPVTVASIALGVNTTCTSTAHGLVNGDIIELDGVTIYDDDDNVLRSLDGRWVVANKTANTFRLAYEYDNIDAVPPITAGDILDTTDEASGYYDGTGFFRKGFASVAGLSHLEGRTVVALCDGSVVEGLTVTGGAVTPDGEKHFRVHVGLSFQSVLGTLDLFNSQGDDTGVTKAVPEVFARLYRTRGLKFGQTEDEVHEEIYTREDEGYLDPSALEDGLYRINLWQDWGPDQSLFIVQDYPLPMTVLGLTFKQDYGGDGG